jgi:hypothetical protein
VEALAAHYDASVGPCGMALGGGLEASDALGLSNLGRVSLVSLSRKVSAEDDEFPGGR